MDHITHEMRLANWKSIIEQCNARPEGKTIKQWLSEQGIHEKQYYYWQRLVRREAYEQMKINLPTLGSTSTPAFAEIPYHTTTVGSTLQFKPDAVIRTSKVTIELSNSISDHLLSKILGGLGRAQ